MQVFAVVAGLAAFVILVVIVAFVVLVVVFSSLWMTLFLMLSLSPLWFLSWFFVFVNKVVVFSVVVVVIVVHDVEPYIITD